MNKADEMTLESRIMLALDRDIKPALQMDGGQVEFVDVNQGVVRLRLTGSCSGCPSTIMAILMEVEQELRQRVPGVEYVELTGG